MKNEITIKPVSKTLAQVAKAESARNQRVRDALNALPEGYEIKAGKKIWKKQIIAGDGFWINGKKFYSPNQLLLNIGSKFIEPHVLPGILDWNVDRY